MNLPALHHSLAALSHATIAEAADILGTSHQAVQDLLSRKVLREVELEFPGGIVRRKIPMDQVLAYRARRKHR